MSRSVKSSSLFFFFNDTATTEIYTLSLHDALPICHDPRGRRAADGKRHHRPSRRRAVSFCDLRQAHSHGRLGLAEDRKMRSEEHTSELQSLRHLVCRLLLEKKKLKLTAASNMRVRL